MDLAVSLAIAFTVLGVAVIAVPDVAMQWVQRNSPEVVFQVDADSRMLALTIDDGPSSATPEILEVLEEHGARATFFLVGDEVARRPGLARSIVEAGHELGHHMMEDRPSRGLSDETFDDRFEEMHRILEGLGGSRLFRPGSGWYDDRMVRTARERGYRTVLGSVYPFDAHLPWPTLVTWYVRRNAGPGSIVILHDGPERGVRTAKVLRSLLPELTRRGFRFVTVSELLAGNAEE